jgi:hypothetical protein
VCSCDQFLYICSYKLDQRLVSIFDDRIPALLADRSDAPDIDTAFLNDAIKELLRNRLTLSYSYVQAYFIEAGVTRNQYEQVQGECESSTELLNSMLSRKALRNSSRQIIAMTKVAVESRKNLTDLSSAIVISL